MKRKSFTIAAAGVLLLSVIILSGCSELEKKPNPNDPYDNYNYSTVPSTPTGLYASASSSSSVTLSWSTVSSATSYIVYRSSSSGGTYTQIGTPTSTSYTNTGLSASTTYYYKVAAKNSYGTSSLSGYVSATTSSSGGSGTGTIIFKNTSTHGDDNPVYVTLNYSSSGTVYMYGNCYNNGGTLTFNNVPAGTSFYLKSVAKDDLTKQSATFSLTAGQTRTFVYNASTIQ